MPRSAVIFALVLSLIPGVLCAAEPDLAHGFANPPASAKPHTWWHWMNGNITSEGITRDLEAMKRVGLGGAQLFNVSAASEGPVRFMSDEWRRMVKHAASEADRLGLDLCVHNCAGWSSSGGPWITPANAMQQVVWSEYHVAGSARVSCVLPRPLTKLGYYRDIAVLAVRTPQSESVRLPDLSPRITIPGGGSIDSPQLFDGDAATYASIPVGPDGRPCLRLEFAKPYTARSLSIVCGPRRSADGELQISDDGTEFRTVCRFTMPNSQPVTPDWVRVFSFGEVTSRFYRLIFGQPEGLRDLPLAELDLSGGYRIENIDAKAAFTRQDVPARSAVAAVTAGDVIARNDALDLTTLMDADGRLVWNAPSGSWTILRFGYTPMGKTNHPAPAEATGLECDKLSRKALDAHWAGMMARIISDIGPLAGKTLNNALIDSYETGAQNWTPLFREEFMKRRGYDLLPWLPTLTGRVVVNLEMSERFLWDFRRTIADLWADSYYGYFADLCHKHGMRFSTEAYGNGIFDDLSCAARADIPMSEFWSGSGGDGGLSKEASSVAHINGLRYVGAESFTAGEDGWQYDPYSLKALGDLMYCGGVNRFIFHTYAHQPWTDGRKPAMTMGANGIHFDRMVTWWDQAPAWLSYITRCQYLLQQGTFVGDLCYLCSEGAPTGLPGRDGLQPTPPAGYDYDGCTPEMLLSRASVKNGRVVIGSMSYRVLVLPNSDTITPRTLRKVRDLVAAGAVIYGPKPVRSPSLSDYGKGDAEVRRLADAVWGASDGKSVAQHAYGKGRVVWGEPIADLLISLKLRPDFEYSGKGVRLAYIHRRSGGSDIYFLSNQRDRMEYVDCSFRLTGKVPELWHPDTGKTERLSIYIEKDGRTTIPLTLGPAESVFVVFRRNQNPGDHPVSLRRNGEPLAFRRSAGHLEVQRAIYGVLDDPRKTVDVTATVAGMVDHDELSMQAGNQLAGDPAPLVVKAFRIDYSLNGVSQSKTIREGAFLDIPESAHGAYPPAELVCDNAGRSVLQAWETGVYEVKTASARTINVPVRGFQEPLAINDRWEVRFPRGWGAPESVVFDELISWTDHTDSAIRFFSGTAEYVRTVDIPASLLASDTLLYLDLGDVRNIAEVTLNGKAVGTLWKPPFRLDVTGSVHPGRNSLRIKVTNTWVNRLIGDSGLPADRRLAWTTFNPYRPDSPLPGSGLLGPVTLRPVKRMPIPGMSGD